MKVPWSGTQIEWTWWINYDMTKKKKRHKNGNGSQVSAGIVVSKNFCPLVLGWIVEIFMWPIFLSYFKWFEIFLRLWTACLAVEVSCSNVDPQMGGSSAASRTQPARKEDEEEEFREHRVTWTRVVKRPFLFRKCRCYSLIIPLRVWTTGPQGCILAEVIFPIYFWFMVYPFFSLNMLRAWKHGTRGGALRSGIQFVIYLNCRLIRKICLLYNCGAVRGFGRIWISLRLFCSLCWRRRQHLTWKSCRQQKHPECLTVGNIPVMSLPPFMYLLFPCMAEFCVTRT